MNIHEYQAKAILRDYKVKVPKGKVAFSPYEAVQAAKKLPGKRWVIKAQVHAGGRGKGGGVRVAESLEEVKAYASEILSMKLVTDQTGPEGKHVDRLLIEQAVDIDRELYLGMTVDRETPAIVMMASSEGGMEIEKVAEENPEAIHKESIDPGIGFRPFQANNLARKLGLNKQQSKEAVKFMSGLYRMFIEKDCSLAEINPLVVKKNNGIVALDAKLNFDGNGLFRHKEVIELRDLREEDPKEVEASKHDLSYIHLNGNIGCMVNGAGLAMATMDIIKLYGGEPANFLDVGGSASEMRVKAAFKIILSDPNVKAILVNIFGGIMQCDIIARGVVSAAKDIKLQVPLVVRLEGTNAEKGKAIMNESALDIIPASSMEEAARKAVEEASK
jgi:succinyl-CoA synthetase beta subunit